jgi:hypothetical protein
MDEIGQLDQMANPWGSMGMPEDGGGFFGGAPSARDEMGNVIDPRAVTLNGQQYKRTGEDWQDSYARPELRAVLDQFAPEQRSIYNSQYGWLMPQNVWNPLSDAAAKANRAGEDFVDKGYGGLALIAIPAAAVAAGAGAAAAGAGAAEAGGGLAAELGTAGAYGGSTAADLAALEGGVGATAGGAGGIASASPYASWGSFDPIQAIDALDKVGGGMGASAGAQSLGYASVSDAIANAASWAGPGAFSAAQGAGPGGATPDASFRGLAEKLGRGVSPSDLLRSVTGDLGTMLAKFGVPGFGGSMGGALGFGGAMSPWSIGQGLYGLYSSNRMRKDAKALGERADPWGKYRPARAAELDALSRDPSTIVNDPGYKAGLQAVERRMLAQGFQGSGNMMKALQDFGGNFYEQAIARLSGLAGAGQNPAAGPTLEMQGKVNAANLAGQSLNRFAYGMTR